MASLPDVLGEFAQQRVEGHLFDSDGLQTAALYYDREGDTQVFVFRPLGDEESPELRFRDGLLTEPTDSSTGVQGAEDMGIFLLLDPRTFIGVADRAVETDAGKFKLAYRLRDLTRQSFARVKDLPDTRDGMREYARSLQTNPDLPRRSQEARLDMAEPLFELLTMRREVEFAVESARLSRMEQEDLPPSSDRVRVDFLYVSE
jgi:hypothetical protein